MNGRYDFQQLKQQASLAALVSGFIDLGRKPDAASGGGEWKGPCPLCGQADKDGFAVQPYHQPEARWLCRKCTDGKWKDVIEFAERLWPGLEKREVYQQLAGGKLPMTTTARPKPQPRPAAEPPTGDWQQAAWQILAETQAMLWEPRSRPVRDYLYSRGLTNQTIQRFGLGYLATGEKHKYGREIAGLYVPRGIVIPGTLYDEVWYIKIRLLPGVPVLCQGCKAELLGPGTCPNCGKSNKYRGVKGNRPAAIYNAADLTPGYPAIILEGEFDVMLAWQEARDLVPAATIGSATNQPDVATWGRYFNAPNKTLILPDNDEAGGLFANTLVENSRYPILAGLPNNSKDLTEFHQRGGNIRTWIAELLEAYDPLPAQDIFSLAAELGATVTELDPKPAR